METTLKYAIPLFTGLLTTEVAHVNNSMKKTKIKESDSDYIKLAKSGGHTGKHHFFQKRL